MVVDLHFSQFWPKLHFVGTFWCPVLNNIFNENAYVQSDISFIAYGRTDGRIDGHCCARHYSLMYWNVLSKWQEAAASARMTTRLADGFQVAFLSKYDLSSSFAESSVGTVMSHNGNYSFLISILQPWLLRAKVLTLLRPAAVFTLTHPFLIWSLAAMLLKRQFTEAW